MSVRASSTAVELFGRVSIYFEDDRVEVGTSNLMCQEEMRRVAYRDVRRLVSWPDTRKGHRYVGLFLLVGALFGIALAVLFAANGTADGEVTGVVFGVLAAVVAALSGVLLYAGRSNGITRVRIEAVRGSLDAVLAGSAKKRAAVLSELEDRIRARQSAR